MGQTKRRKPAVRPVGRVEATRGGPQADLFDWRTFDPSMLEGGAEAPLATELITYRDRLDELLANKGRYVLIKGQEVAGFFPDRRSAIEAGIAAYGPGPFLVKQVVETEPILTIGLASP